MVIEMIKQAQYGDQLAMESLISKFEPLINKYSRLLNTEDAKNELVLDFIVLIQAIHLEQLYSLSDAYAVGCISKAVKFAYIKHSKKLAEERDNVSFIADLNEGLKSRMSTNKDDFSALIANSYLFDSPAINECEKSILKMIFINGYSAAEIARIEHITRQAVNQMKKRALEKLQQEICN